MKHNEMEYEFYMQRTVIDKLVEGLYDPTATNLAWLKNRRENLDVGKADIPLKMLKYQTVRLIGILEYELVRLGVPEQTIYVSSNRHIRMIEDAKTAEDIRETFYLVYQSLQSISAFTVQRPRTSFNEDILSYIENATTKKYTLDDMAADLGYNRSYMCSKFKKLTGKTIRKYDTECRIKEAKVLLQRTDMPLKDIARRLCFSDQSHFQRVFHREAGVTPQRFRDGT